MTRFAAICLIAVALVATAGAQAALVVYEPFDGYTAGTLKTQAPNANTIGLDSAQAYTSSSANSVHTAQVAGLTFSDLLTNGGSLRVAASGNPNTIGTKVSTTAVTGDLFVSYLVNIDQYGGSATGPAGVGLGVSHLLNGAGSNGTLQVLADISTANLQKVGLTYAGGGGTAGSTGLLEDTTYLVLAKFTGIGLPLNGTTNKGVATLWAVTAEQYDSIKAGGVTEAALNAATIGTGAADVTARMSVTATTGTYLFDNTRYMTIAAWGVSTNEIATLDEIRYGTTIADVIPVVPEPATLLLIALGTVGLIRRK